MQVLLFSDKEEVPGVLRALSCNFRPYKMDFGIASATNDKIMKQFNVKKVGRAGRGGAGESLLDAA